MIYCHRGWVRVLYEDQGPPFVMHAGDCVLQAPEIRHRVLESSSGTEVIEFTCPARHDTFADHDLVLPNSTVAPSRAFNGQQFVHHQATAAVWRPWFAPGFECRDLGVAQGSAGIARAGVLRRCAPDTGHQPWCHDGDFWSLVVLNGSAELQRSGSNEPLEAGDCAVIPRGEPFTLARNSADFEFLEVAMPAGGLRTVGSS